MGRIRVLSEQIANKIAAGEVIERPSSIVKELVENALDAGAGSIEITIEHGGKSLIRVSDNGCGMDSEDAGLALKRHATSKIRSEKDLAGIQSFGFRGEALPSIAAVSRFRLCTRTAEQETGVEICVEGGIQTRAAELGCSPGTVIEVRDLFFNTPARRKFLRADSTEMGHVMDAVAHMALVSPGVRFLFKSSNRTVLDLIPAESLKTRAVAVWGEATGKHLLEVSSAVKGIHISGVIGKPCLARHNRTGQTFYVNGRWVRSFSLGHALLAGYHGLLMHGQFPMAALLIDLDLDRVDVNVHPTKQEVRISQESEVKSLIRKVVAERLRQEPDLAPRLRLPGEPAFPMGEMRPSVPPPVFSYSGGTATRFSSLRTEEPVQEEFSGAESDAVPSAADHAGPALSENLIDIREKLKITRILGQIHNTFILAETTEGYMVIDQHAAHERVMFEDLLKNASREKPVSQALLMDEVLELHPRQIAFFRRAISTLRKTGFELDEFGETAWIIRAVPAVIEKENPVLFLKRFVEEVEEGKLQTRLGTLKEDLAALTACKKRSVKAHDPLQPEAVRTLLVRLAACENPFSCPHGRPAFFRQSFSDLERQFKRKS